MSLDPQTLPGRIAFISTRLAGTDGVSLETAKWADVLTRMGLECFYIAGKCDRPPERTIEIAEAHFDHPTIREIDRAAFSGERRSEELTCAILETTQHLRVELSRALEELRPDLLIVENALTIPMNIPLGMALIQVLQQTTLPCIVHHHDFVWERERFRINCVDDFLAAAFPPRLHQVHHVVINRRAGEEFGRRTGLPYRVIPNVMDFRNPPAPRQPSEQRFRQSIGLAPDELMILQPTRIVARKAIERSIELIRRLDDPRARLVITHQSGDEGQSYEQYLRTFADLLGVDLIFAADRVQQDGENDSEDAGRLSIEEIYPEADLVTYPSSYEGFGNAFLEAIYFKKPILCNRYAIYQTDIEPSGIQPIAFDGFLTPEVLDEVRRVLNDETYRQEMVEHNYQTAQRYFSYEILEVELRDAFRWLALHARL